MSKRIRFSEAFTLLCNELKEQRSGTGPITLSAQVFDAFKQTTVAGETEHLKLLMRLFDGTQKKGYFLRLDAKSMYLVVSVVMQFSPDYVFEKMIHFIMDNFKIYHQSSKHKILQRYFSKEQIDHQINRWHDYTASKLVTRLCRVISDDRQQLEARRMAVELLTSICGNDSDLWHKVVANDLADDGNVWAVFRTADDCVLRMLLANVFRRMSNVSVPREQIYDLETVVPEGFNNKRTDQAFIEAAIDLINSLNTKSTFDGTRQSHIFRAYIDSNSTQRLAQVRHVVGALNVLLRQDLGYGAVTGWNFNEEENKKCFCVRQFDVKACSIQGIYRTTDVLKHDPDSFACAKTKNSYTGEITSSANLIVEAMLKFPLDPVEVQRLQDLLPMTRPRKPIAFVFGHGLWNDLDLQATVNWLDGILSAVYDKAPYLQPRNLPRDKTPQDQPLSHMLFMTPNAAGIRKPDQWLTSQGDKALQMFEHSVRDLIFEPGERWYGRSIEHIGTWNMSIQMEKWDGVHLDLKGNLVKAMGIMNWLAFVEVERW